MFNLKKEILKKNLFFILQIAFAILTLVCCGLLFFDAISNAGIIVIMMLFSLIFGALSRNSKKAISENMDLHTALGVRTDSWTKSIICINKHRPVFNRT